MNNADTSLGNQGKQSHIHRGSSDQFINTSPQSFPTISPGISLPGDSYGSFGGYDSSIQIGNKRKASHPQDVDQSRQAPGMDDRDRRFIIFGQTYSGHSAELDASEHVVSPETLSTYDEYAANPRYIELQEELRALLFTSANSAATTRAPTPDQSGLLQGTSSPSKPKYSSRSSYLLETGISIPRGIRYLKAWIADIAPWLDMFDSSRQFGIQVPILAQTSPALLYGLLALSARQIERKQGTKGSNESLELYQESIRHLTLSLSARDPNVLATACILCCLEMMSASPRDWRRHVEGCAALFQSFGVNGFSGGLLQAVFWCYARMDLCGAIIAEGAESTVLPLEKWVPPPADAKAISRAFLESGREVPDMHANYAVYLCAKACDLVSTHARADEIHEGGADADDNFRARWEELWEELQIWTRDRPLQLLPLKTVSSGQEKAFPEIFFVHWAAISSNQLYHTACIMMLEMKPPSCRLSATTPCNSAVWHARRVCGISITNPHEGCLNNAIQPLFVAGKLLSHRSEHLAIVGLIRKIEKTTGWGACWRIKDFESIWGYSRGELAGGTSFS